MTLEPCKPRSAVGRLIRDHVASLITVLELLTFCAGVILLAKTAINEIPHLKHQLGTNGSLYVTIGIALAGIVLLLTSQGHRVVRGTGVLALLVAVSLGLSLSHAHQESVQQAQSPSVRPHKVHRQPPEKRVSRKRPLLHASSTAQPMVAKAIPEPTQTAPLQSSAKTANCGCDKLVGDAAAPKEEGRRTKDTEATDYETQGAETTTQKATSSPVQTTAGTPPTVSPTSTTSTMTSPASTESGIGDSGIDDTGSYDSGNYDSGNYDAGDNDSGNNDFENNDIGNYDSGEYDSGNHDSGEDDSGNYDTGNYQSGNNE